MKKISMILAAIIGFFAGFSFMLYMMEFILTKDMSVGIKIYYFAFALVAACVSGLLHTIIHEGGHLIFGLLSGYRFSSFRVGKFMIKKENNKFVVKKYELAGTGGQCLLAPPQLIDGKMPYFWYNIGGALMNILFALISILIMIFTSEIKIISLFFFTFAMVGIFMGMANGIPLRVGELDNDGMNVISMSRDAYAVKAMWQQLKVNELISRGVKILDVPEEYFEIPAEANLKNPLISSVVVFKCNRLMAERRFEDADSEMDKLLNGEAVIVGIHKALLKIDRAYCEMISENRREVVDKFLDKDTKAIMNAMKTFPSVKRIEYSYALLVEKDVNKANEIKEKLLNIKKDYPYPSDIEDEMELMQYAYEKYNMEVENGQH